MEEFIQDPITTSPCNPPGHQRQNSRNRVQFASDKTESHESSRPLSREPSVMTSHSDATSLTSGDGTFEDAFGRGGRRWHNRVFPATMGKKWSISDLSVSHHYSHQAFAI